MAQQSIPSNIGTGLVTGRFIVGVADGEDVDVEPDRVPATGRIVFTAAPPYLPAPGATDGSLTILQVPITTVINDQGDLCRPNPLNPGTAGDPDIRLIAEDSPTILVHDWTYKVEYFFDPVNGVTPKIDTHHIRVTVGSETDLTTVAKVPESPGLGDDGVAELIARVDAVVTQVQEDAAAGVFDGPQGPPGNATIRYSTTAGRAAYFTIPGGTTEQRFYGDTGERGLSASMAPFKSGEVILSRVGNVVFLTLQDAVLQDAAAGFLQYLALIPAGFRPTATYSYFNTVARNVTDDVSAVRVSKFGEVTIYGVKAGEAQYGTFSWRTSEAWPTALPGTPIGTIPNL